jgi:putative iron-only hydrogenase system regulator
LPYRERNVSVIALIVDGTTDELGSLTGRLGMVKGVPVCSSLIRKLREAEG